MITTGIVTGKWKSKQYGLEVNVQQMLSTVINVLNSEEGQW